MNAHLNLTSLMPIQSERLSAKDFMDLVRTNPGIIKQFRAIPPSLGTPSFGKFEVIYTRPVYRPVFYKHAG